jgi:hypothetical protein
VRIIHSSVAGVSNNVHKKFFKDLLNHVRTRRRLIVHAGLHKTGTTSVQNFFAAHTAEIEQKGFLYPQSCRGGTSGHHNLAWQLAGDRRFDPRHGSVDSITEEITAFPGDAIISSEDLEGSLESSERLTPLIEHPAFRKYAIIFLIYLRDQVSYAESLFLEMIKHGIPYDARSFCDIIIDAGQISHKEWTFEFDYQVLARTIAETSACALVFRPYGDLFGTSSVSDILEFLRISDLPPYAARDNVRLPPIPAIAIFCATKLGCDSADLAARLEEQFGRHLRGRAMHFTPGRRQAIHKRFRDRNRRLAMSFGFPEILLNQVGQPPLNSFDLEEIFSDETVDAVTDWLRYGNKSGIKRLLTADA